MRYKILEHMRRKYLGKHLMYNDSIFIITSIKNINGFSVTYYDSYNNSKSRGALHMINELEIQFKNYYGISHMYWVLENLYSMDKLPKETQYV